MAMIISLLYTEVMTIYYCLDLRMGKQSFLTMHKQLIHVSGRTKMNLEKANPALDPVSF